MPKFNIRKGDSVVVIAGNDKNRQEPRKVLAVDPKNGRVLVEGVRIVTKHVKPSAQNPQGGIVKQEAYLDISNVMLWDAKAKAGTRVSRLRKEDGTFVRSSKKTNEAI